jgi:hypothetical protein
MKWTPFPYSTSSNDQIRKWNKGESMEDIFLVLGWGSPIGTGIFLLCLAGMIYLLTKASKKKE